MKHFFFLQSLFAIIFICTGCNRSKEVVNGHYFDEFPKETTINFQRYLQLDSSISSSAIFIQDTSIIAVNGEKLKKDYLFYEYSLRSKTLVGKYIRWGSGENRIYGPMSYGVDQNSFWVHDNSLNKILLGSLAQKKGFDSIAGVKEFKTSKFSYSVQLMKEAKLLNSGIFHVPEYLQITDVSKDVPVKSIATFVRPDSTLPLNTWKAAYEGFLMLKPSNDKAVIACRYADRITLFDLKTGKYKIIIGPTHFEPEFVPMNYADHAISRNDKTIFAFLKGGVVTENYIYLMYSGKKQGEPNFNLSNCIYVYNWDGKPIKTLKLDRYVSAIGVSADNSELYAIDPESNVLVRSKLNI